MRRNETLKIEFSLIRWYVSMIAKIIDFLIKSIFKNIKNLNIHKNIFNKIFNVNAKFI